MSKKATDIVAYITPIGLILAFLIGDRENCKFHINQALVIWLASIIVNVVENILDGFPVLGTLISIVAVICDIALFVFWIMGLVSACKETEKPVPVLGGIQLYK